MRPSVRKTLLICILFFVLFITPQLTYAITWNVVATDSFTRIDGALGNGWYESAASSTVSQNRLNLVSGTATPWNNRLLLRSTTTENSLNQRVTMKYYNSQLADLWLTFRVQGNGSNEYLVGFRGPGGNKIDIGKVSGGTITQSIAVGTISPSYTSSHAYLLDASVEGSNPTIIRATSTDLSTGLVVATTTLTDSTSGLQQAGGYGMFSYTNTGTLLDDYTSYDDHVSPPTPPTVQITSPTANSTIRGTVNLTASSTDDVGVAATQFTVDGLTVGPGGTGSTYTYAWNSKTISDGAHTLIADSNDAAGSHGTTSIAFTTNNWTTNFADNFNRADGNIGNGWVGATSTATTTSNQLIVNSGNATPWTNKLLLRPSSENTLDQRGVITTLPTINTTSGVYLSLRTQTPGTEYLVGMNFSGGVGNISYTKSIAGSLSTIINTPFASSSALDVNHAYKLDAIAVGSNPTTIYAQITDVNTGQIVDRYSTTDSDSNLQTAGQIGFYAYGFTTVPVDDFTSYQILNNAINYTLTGPTSTDLNSTSTNFTLLPDGNYNGTITPSDGGAGGIFSPSSVVYSNEASAKTFTYTPTSMGAKTISVTSSPALNNPSSLSMAVTVPGLGVVGVTDPKLVWSPYNWRFNGSSWAQTAPGGAYVKIGFTGTSLGIGVSTSTNVGVTLSGVKIHAYIDGSPTPIEKSLADAGNGGVITFSSALASSSHYAIIYLSKTPQIVDRWYGPNESIRITKFQLAADGNGTTTSLTSTPLAKKARKIIYFGDSITEGVLVSQDENAHSAIVGQLLGVEYGQVGYGYLGWSHQGTAGSTYFYESTSTNTSVWRNYDASTTRMVDNNNLSSGFIDGTPDAVYVNLGINDANTGVSPSEVRGKVTAWLSDIRQSVGQYPAVFVVCPFNLGNTGNSTYVSHKAAILGGITDYQAANPSDVRVYFIDLGNAGFSTVQANSSDGLHPNDTGSLYLGTSIASSTSGYIITPVTSVSAVSASSTATSTSIRWNSDQLASSIVDFGLTTAYGSTTIETENSSSTQVTAHTKIISGLPSCTLYHYRVKSRDLALLFATSSDSTFITNCTGGSSVLATNVNTITTASGGSLSLGNISITVPTSFTATSTSVQFQAHQLATSTFFTAAGTPIGGSRIGNSVYALRAIATSTTLISSFNQPITVVMSYQLSDVTNIDPQSLNIKRYDGSTWSNLTGCSVDTNARTVTCQTTNFSEFALFSQSSISASPTTIVNGSTGNSVTVTGVNTAFTGSPFTLSGGTGASISGQSIASSSSATITLTAGTLNGVLIITDVNSGATTSVTVIPDTIAPTISITAPTGTATTSGTISLTATSSDNISVTSVQFRVDGVAQGASGSTSPYTVSWNTAGVSDGPHIVTATARDSSGNQATSTITVITDNTGPVISAASSTPGISTSTITWTTNENSDTLVEYGLTSTYTSSSTYAASLIKSHSASLSGLTSATTYHYRVISVDALGNRTNGTDLTFATLDITAPVVTLTAPTANATTSGTISLTATSSDNVAVTGVQFYVDGITQGTSGTSSPYSVSWNTRLVSDGPHTVSAVARDAAGNQATSTITSKVDNTGPVISAASSTPGVSTSTITWTTNESSDTLVEYGPTTTYTSSSTYNGALLTSHTVSLTSLSPSTLYHYRVISVDALGNRTNGSDLTFTTQAGPDLVAPIISSIATSSLATSSVTLLWITNEPADGQIFYGTTTSYGLQTSLNSVASTSHSFTITGLTPNTLYHYQVRSADPSSNLATSSDQTFTTNALAVSRPTLTQQSATSVSTSTVTLNATITSDGNGSSTSRGFNYGTTLSYGSVASTTGTYGVGAFALSLSGLTPNTLYHAQAFTVNGAGTGTSSDITFTTAVIPDTTAPSILSTSSSTAQTSVTIGWTTNEVSDSQVNYGTTTAYGASSILDTSTTTSHSVTITGLTASTLYHFQILTRDPSGNLTTSSDLTFTTTATPDTTPPSISIIAPTTGSTVGGTVLISTSAIDNVAPSSIQLYVDGATPSSSGGGSGGSGNTLTYAISWTSGSVADGSHIISAVARDSSGNQATTTITVTTDNTGPSISLASSTPGVSTSSISWTTNESSDTLVEYGPTTTYTSSSTYNGALLTSHTVSLTSLSPSTLYHYRVISVDVLGNRTNGSDLTFTTLVGADVTAPVISSITTPSVGTSSVTIGWNTNEVADTQVEYGLTSSYTASSTYSASLVTSHTVTLTGLTASTTYHYRVISSDAALNRSVSTDQVVTTSATQDTTAPTVSITTPTTGATATGTITLTAVSSDDTAVTGVQFYIDGSLQGASGTSSPYSVSWDTALISDASHTVSAVARDAAGNQATSTILVTTNNGGFTLNSIVAIVTSTTATVTWTSSQSASTKLSYGLLSGVYTTVTSETDTSPRVTSHTVSISGLALCTTYYYLATSRSALLNTATSSELTFTTSGCTQSAVVATSSAVYAATSTGATTTLTTTAGRDVTLYVPPEFTSTSSAAVFQIKDLNAAAFYSGAGNPSGVVRVGLSAVNLAAYTGAQTPLTSFIVPVTVTIKYTTGDIQNIDENSLKIYQYDTGTWTPLSNCIVNSTAKTVTCQTTHFSDFGLFGTYIAPVASQQNNGGGGGGGGGGGDATGIIYYNRPVVTSTKTTQTQYNLIPASVIFTRSLSLNMTGADVKALQQFLNNNGFTIAKTGTGSRGKETTKFAAATKKAVILFQNTYADAILKPVGLKTGNGTVGKATYTFINQLRQPVVQTVVTTPVAPVVQNVQTAPVVSTQQSVTPTPASIAQAVASSLSYSVSLPLLQHTLVYGSTGQEVKSLQFYLSTMPGIYPEAGVTGEFDLKTQLAVQRFQLVFGIIKKKTDGGYGKVGPATREKINQLIQGKVF